jgi:methionyl aminopeptidase
VADSAFTAGVAEISPVAHKLLATTERALYAGIAQMRAGNHVGDISAAVQQVVEGQGLHVTREYTGHGVGRSMHEGPQVPNYGVAGKGMLLKAGMTIALEPMVLVGTWLTRVMPDDWTVCSQDRSLTCHFEHTIAITDDGPSILTLLPDGSAPAQIGGPGQLIKS